jgi:hypothetical protein
LFNKNNPEDTGRTELVFDLLACAVPAGAEFADGAESTLVFELGLNGRTNKL